MTSTTMHCALLPLERAAANPHALCLSEPGRSMDNAAFSEAVQAVALKLREGGADRDDVVAVLLPNCAEMVVTMFAAWYIGACLTPINPGFTADEVVYQLQDSNATVLVTDPSLVPALNRSSCPVVLTGSDFLRPSGRGPDPAESTQDALALLIYTSGTTGQPKGVMLDHANLNAMSSSIIEHFGLGSADRSLLVLPLFHANGLIAGTFSVLRAGGDVAIVPRFDPHAFWDAVEQFRPTYFSAVPTVYGMLDALPEHVQPNTSYLRFAVCGAAPMSAELIERFERRYRVPLVEGYGLSEGTVASVINPLHGIRKAGTVGVPLPGQSVWVVDDKGRRLPPGERGEVVITGPTVMRGYLGRPEETAKTVREGWLHTGDVGVFDEDGYLTIVDRVKDMIIRGGENIYPKEIENVLYSHPDVIEAAVVGAPDPKWGEVPVAFVSLRPDNQTSVHSLTAHCEKRLARYKRPVRMEICDQLPKNAVGKITKGPLRDRLTPAKAH